MKIENYQIGCDNELFLKDKITGKYYTAEGIIKGTKANPYKFDPLNDYFATSLDCVLAEYNIPPAKNPEELWASIEKCHQYIKSLLPENMIISCDPAARLDEDQLITPTSIIFGCETSLSCYSEEEIRPINTGDNLRSAGSHFHSGYDNPNEEINREAVRAMDLFIGVPSILIEPENERKKVGYGCAGNYRNKKYGFEYRSLSAYFTSEKRLVEWVFNNSKKAIQFVNDNNVKDIIDLGHVIQSCINNENKYTAELLVKEFNLELV